MAFQMTDKAFEVLTSRAADKRHEVYVFPNRAGDGPRRYSGKALSKAIDRAGLGAEVTPHVIRHSVATKLHDAGMPLMQVQYVLGHASIQTTAKYIHTSKQKAATEAAKILNGRVD
jgi:integrase/recombinase XerD